MIKSPFNYIGGKFKILEQIFEFFPHNINNFVDLFAGGLDVSININANNIFCNDINYKLIEIYKEMQTLTIENLLAKIDERITRFNLSKTNKEGYLNLRKQYNKHQNPIDLYVLVCFSFNYQFRFNSKMEYNNPFGKDRSSFTEVMRENLKRFHSAILPFHFDAMDFRDYNLEFLRENDFIYADPPYLISCGSYNDGKRGFKGWSAEDDLALFDTLNTINNQGSRFALSNVITHKGEDNGPLIEWAEHYNIHFINNNYNNSNYQSRSRQNETQEVLITNF